MTERGRAIAPRCAHHPPSPPATHAFDDDEHTSPGGQSLFTEHVPHWRRTESHPGGPFGEQSMYVRHCEQDSRLQYGVFGFWFMQSVSVTHSTQLFVASQTGVELLAEDCWQSALVTQMTHRPVLVRQTGVMPVGSHAPAGEVHEG
jgi:hypothetical protein